MFSKVVHYLLTNPHSPADVNQADGHGMTPLMHAVKTNDARAVYGLFNTDSLRSFDGR